MRKSNLFCVVLCCAVACGLFSGCKSATVAESGQPYTPVRGTKGIPAEIMVHQIVDSTLEWTDVAMPVKFVLRSPKSVTLSGRATMIRGREIKISFRMLGFEVGGLYADTDSIYFYEKLNRTMVVESMDRLRNEAGLELENIQDLLLGRVTYPGRIDSPEGLLKKFKIEEDDASVMLVPRSSALPWHYLISDVDGTAVLQSLTVEVPSHGQIICSFVNPLQTPVGSVTPDVTITAAFDKQKLDASLLWSLESASWNKALTPSPSIPKGYRRIPLAALLKSLAPPQQPN